jgi:hypothetical protein
MKRTKAEWRAVPGYEGRYELSPEGRVRAVHTYNWRAGDRELSIWKDKDGYLQVTLHRDGVKRHFKIHRLLLAVFVGPPPSPKAVAAHRNDIPDDNRLCNLVWATHRENCVMRDENGGNPKGEERWNAKLTQELVRHIRWRAKTERQADIARETGVPRKQVWAVVHNKIWRHVA